ncbi:MAG: UDP-N-acetylmuramoyl-L-alanyl-D-glutamate--2,6-diaminopimelate ligase [Candidatus Omnitrophica bacterium]|nr:UDP-N-acetylmuramoyl-L-alanyl-D-glutamate--2,6-diaminopimelate ligase [Candidatus Omnitrophota bacterium]
MKGNKVDGHKFIQEAIDRGAKAVIYQTPRHPACLAGRKDTKTQEKVNFIRVEDTRKTLAKLSAEFYCNPSKKMNVVGITGTNGKTTVSYLIEALLKEAKKGFAPAVIGTVNYRFKNKAIPSINTTPGPIELESMLADMLKEGVNYAVMEVSSHALDQCRTEGINFHSAIFTNLTQDHLDYHDTLEKYFLAKARLFKNLRPSSFVIINNDDEYGRRIKRLTRAKVATYGINTKADVMAKDIKFGISHTEFLLVAFDKEIKIKTRLIGRHNVYNILAAACWAYKEGLGLPILKFAMEKFSLVPGRLERIEFKGGFSVFVDYAHTEDALRNVINSLRQLSPNRIIVVFGCGGQRDKTKRPKMGYIVSELADYAIVTNDNPRLEDHLKIIGDIKKGIRKNNYCVIPERKEAIKKALSLAKTQDIVLVAGKGHENYQILKSGKVHFDDREAIRECLRLKNY